MASESDPVATFVTAVQKQLKAPLLDPGSILIGVAGVLIAAVLWRMLQRPPAALPSSAQAAPQPTRGAVVQIPQPTDRKAS